MADTTMMDIERRFSRWLYPRRKVAYVALAALGVIVPTAIMKHKFDSPDSPEKNALVVQAITLSNLRIDYTGKAIADTFSDLYRDLNADPDKNPEVAAARENYIASLKLFHEAVKAYCANHARDAAFCSRAQDAPENAIGNIEREIARADARLKTPQPQVKPSKGKPFNR